MVLSGVVVDLMNGLGGVNDVRFDSLCNVVSAGHWAEMGVERVRRTLLNDRLDVLIDMMMHMLSRDGRGGARSVLALNSLRGVSVLARLSSKTFLHPAWVVVLV